MKKQILTIAAALTVTLIAGCGGGGSTPATSSSPAAVSGTVADGYLVGATVFLDKNGNYQLDAGEPYTTTDKNGAYTLSVDPADVGKYPIVAMAIKDQTIDLDTNLAVQNSYILSMPKESVSGTVNSNFISPMSTQVRELMGTGKYANVQDAMDGLSKKLGMPAGTNLMTDYIAAKNDLIHNAARNMAGLMGGQMTQVFIPSGSTTTLDVNRYRGMVGTIFSNMSSLRSPGANIQALGGSMTANLPIITPGKPYRNMSTSFRGGPMGGGTVAISGNTMKGSAAGSQVSPK